MVIGGLITTKMPKAVVEKEPYVFIFIGAFFGFVFAEAIIGILLLGLFGSFAFAVNRSWTDIEPLVKNWCDSVREGKPLNHIDAAAHQSPRILDEQHEQRRAERDQTAQEVYEQIVAEVEAQAQRFRYPEELKQHEIKHRFRRWSEQSLRN